MIGQILMERYRIDNEIGKGGFGIVYRATDISTNTIVAVKQLIPEISDTEAIQRFEREGEALRDLDHPNIVKLLDSVWSNDQYFLIMEYVSGGDLAQLLRQGPLPIQRIITMAIDLADALTRAHKLNIIHRDLKPANILLSQDDTLRLGDFGVAHLDKQQRITAIGVTIGTFDYLSPEALQEEPIDTRTDIWAFGVILFEMLTGQRPFQGENILDLAVNIMQSDIPDLEDIRPDAPIALVDLVYHMLERNPQERIGSVRHVGAALEDILLRRDSAQLQRHFEPIALEAKHNLPAKTTHFVGRETELKELEALLADSAIQLVTLLAPGGMGKTQLSIELAYRVLDDFANGVFFVDLTQITSASQLTTMIARVLDFTPVNQRVALEAALLSFLSDKVMLLVLDNFEHVIDAADFVNQIVKQAPHVQIVVTSRVRLNLLAETPYQIHGLHYPETGQMTELDHNASVRLFLQTMHRINPKDKPDMHMIAAICRKLSGMPLAILLAATWTGTLTLEELLDDLELDLLDTDLQDVPNRQQSMRHILEQTWQMLSEAEYDAMMMLSAFQGSFSRDAAQEIAGVNLKMLRSLQSRALLQRQATTGRYKVHEVLRLFAAEHLEASGKQDYVRDLHLAYFVGLARHQSRHMLCIQQQPTPIEPEATLDALTDREREVLYYMSQGYTNRDIADALFITLSTVKAHANRIFSKLDVRSRTQAVVDARKRGILM